MNLKTLKISTQLFVSFGVILVFVLLLGGLSTYNTYRIWQEFQGLYEHPLTVRHALMIIQNDVHKIGMDMNRLVSMENSDDHSQLKQNIEIAEAEALQNFSVLYDRYLGPKTDVQNANTSFIAWRSIRAETLRMLETGQQDQALQRLAIGGAEEVQLNRVLSDLTVIQDFAVARAEKFYSDALATRNMLLVQLFVLVSVILLATLIISWLLIRAIRLPLTQFGRVADEFRLGNLSARIHYQGAGEFQVLAGSLNSLAETVQLDIQNREKLSEISQTMLLEQELRPFCKKFLQALMEKTDSHIAAIYLLNDTRTEFVHFESIGLSADRRTTFSSQPGEGEFAIVSATHQIRVIRDIPEDAHFIFSTVSGNIKPREIISIPILQAQEVIAVVSLGGIHAYSATALRLVNDIWSVMSARFNGLVATERIRSLLEKLEGQNRELETQKQELSVQTDELNTQNLELEVQKKQLDEANRLKSAFLSNMSHELRTPLNSVIALSSVLTRRLRSQIPEEEFGYLDVIERNAKHLLELINDILDLSRIEAGKEDLSLTRFAVGDVVREVAMLLQPQAMEKNIRILYPTQGTSPLILSDYNKIRHILQNLVGNAVKFTEKGEVHISTNTAGAVIEIHVRDTGIGIQPEEIPLIFNEFHQADQSTARKFGGTGLGLSIARKYARLLKGEITVESTPGVGSVFTLRIPTSIQGKVDSTHSQQESVPLRPVSVGAPDTLRILIVEDSKPAVIQLTDILVDEGYQVLTARNGKEALDIIHQAVPDAMILDLMMPEVDGFEVLKAIRGMEKTAHLPVLILTAKHISPTELSFLKGNNVHQLIQKGDINRARLLFEIRSMFRPRIETVQPLPPQPQKPIEGEQPKILVVEDNPDNLIAVRALLAGTCQILEAPDGITGITYAKQNHPDLILMDISLPDIDGIQALNAIRKDESLRDIPIYAFTASAMKGSREEILSHGFDGYISKPVDIGTFEQTIVEILHGH